jgi:ubiquinone biosynthesis protein
LDFQIEARNTITVAAIFKATETIRVPTVYEHLSSSYVMVVEWLDGANLRNAEPLINELHLDRIALARDLLHCFLRQVMSSGIFHADPHPGNIMVLRDGRLALIDLGSVGRLDPLQQSALRQMLFAVQNSDGSLLY